MLKRTRRPAVISLLCLLNCAVVSSADVGALILTSVVVIPDGSSSPPGDVLSIHLLPAAFQKNSSLRVRAFLVDDDQQRPVLNARPGPAGETFELVHPLASPPADGETRVKMTVPYADLDIPVGRHALGYTVSLFIGDEHIFTRATELTEVTIGKTERRAMDRVTRREELIAIERRVPLLNSRSVPSQTDDLEPQHPQMTIRDHEMRVSRHRERVAVSIPNGFERKQFQNSIPDGPNATPDDELEILMPSVRLSQVVRDDQRRILYFTNRQRLKPSEASNTGQTKVRFTSQPADQLEYGECLVDIPVQFHRVGQLEGVNWWETRKRGQAFQVEESIALPVQEFVDKSSEDDLLLFVHGFNNSFDGAVLRAAQLAYDLQFRGRSIVFSWPSAGDVSQYDADAKQIATSAKSLADGLWSLLRQNSAAAPTGHKIHLLSHSMGTRVLLQALFQLRRDHPEVAATPAFDQIVLAAPDIGAGMFNNLLTHALLSSRQVTYYFCRKDAALRISQNINHYEPVGLFPYFDARLKTISADSVDTTFMGHVYFSSAPEILQDLHLVFSQGLPPEMRMPPLAGQAETVGNVYWVFVKPSS